MSTKKQPHHTAPSSEEPLKSPKKERNYICGLSELIRFIATIACFLSPLVGVAYAVWTFEEYVWYEILLAGITGEVVSLSSIGLLILALKPLFFFTRLFYLRRVKSREQQESLKQLSMLIIPALDNSEHHNHSIDGLIQTYLLNIELLRASQVEVQKLRSKREQYAEWKWVVAGVIAATAVLVIIGYIIFLAFGFVFLIVVAAFYSANPQKLKYGRGKHYDKQKEEETPQKDPLLFRLFEYISGKDMDAAAGIANKFEEIRRHEADNCRILKELRSYNKHTSAAPDEFDQTTLAPPSIANNLPATQQ